MLRLGVLLLSLTSGVAAQSTKPAADEVKFPPHPRLILPDSDLPAVQQRIKNHAWGKSAFSDLKKRADGWLDKPIDLPNRGGQWSHYYACKKCGTRLKTESPTRHVCPACDEVYTGWPYDDVAISRRHIELAEAARDLALIYRITGERRYADKSKLILLAYAGRYLTYELHNNKGEKNKIGGGRALSQSLSEATWLIKLLHAADSVWSTLCADDIDNLKVKLFYPAAVDVIQKHELKIHNIQCWKNAAVGLTGFLFEDRALISHAIDGEFGFRNQLAHGVTDDGTWAEGAWGYHFYTANALAPLAEAALIGNINLYTPRYKSMLTAPIVMAMPDGKLPAFNDSGTASARGQEIYELALARFNDPVLARPLSTTQRSNLTALLHGVDPLPKAGASESAGSRRYDACGFAILRSGDDENATWLCLKYGPHGGWHGHPDKLSFVLYTGGHVLADDAGVFPYAVPLYKEWAKTTIAHNTVAMDETHQSEATGKCLAFLSSPDHSAVLLDAGDALPNARFRRAAFLLGKDLIVFIDTIETHDQRPHTFDLAYHPQGKWTDLPKLNDIVLPLASSRNASPAYKNLRDLRSITTRQPLHLTTTHANQRRTVTFAATPTDTTYILGTGVGRNASDRVPALLARQRGVAATYIWAIQTAAAADISLAVQGQPIAKGGSIAVGVRRNGESWNLIASPDARAVDQRLRVTPAP